jgi:hypothetical protein
MGNEKINKIKLIISKVDVEKLHHLKKLLKRI